MCRTEVRALHGDRVVDRSSLRAVLTAARRGADRHDRCGVRRSVRGRPAARGGCLARQVHDRGDDLDGAAGRVGHVLGNARRGVRRHGDVVPGEELEVGVIECTSHA